MSLEQALAENTAAVTKLLEFFRSSACAAQPKTEVEQIPAKHKLPKTRYTQTVEQEQVEVANQVVAEEEAKQEKVQYVDVAAAITSFVATHGKDKTIAILAKFGVARGQELKSEQYADVVKSFAEAAEEAELT